MARGLKKRKVADIEIAARFCVSSQMRRKKKSRAGVSVGAANGYRKSQYPGEEIAVSLCPVDMTHEVPACMAREDYAVVCLGARDRSGYATPGKRRFECLVICHGPGANVIWRTDHRRYKHYRGIRRGAGS
jgi:hypothetical protein